MSQQEHEENNAKLLAMVERKDLSVTLDGVSNKDLFEFTKKQLKENYVKPKRLDGRISPNPDDPRYKPPLGLFNLGNNSLFLSDKKGKEEGEEEDEDEVIDIKNNVKMVDGKLVFTEDDQGEQDAEEELLKFNIEVKNDLPYQIYKKIAHFGRLTIEELYAMYGAIEKEMFLIIVNDMINKQYLKKVKDLDRDAIFNDDAKTIEEFVSVIEKEIETLEIMTEDERRMVLEDKSSK